jgi:hypothetical protein
MVPHLLSSLDFGTESENLSENYFDRWVDGNNNVLKDVTIKSVPNGITVTLSVPKLDKASVNGISSFWLGVKPAEDIQIVKVNDQQLPKISAITANINVEKIIPDIVFSNNIPMDPKKGFYPFGEEPKLGDALYIGSEEAFSKKEATISFTFEVADKKSIEAATLLLEYWDGSTWITLNVSAKPDEDPVKSFQKSGSIEFTCPFIPMTEINGQLNRWIRVKLKSGDYGTAGGIEQKDKKDIANKLATTLNTTLNIQTLTTERMMSVLDNSGVAFGFEYRKADLDPPFIKAINISYNYKAEDFGTKVSFRKKIYSNFLFQNYEIERGPQKPFIPYDGVPALYLGFKENIADTPLNLFFAVKEQLYNAQPETEDGSSSFSNQGSDALSLTWECAGAADKWITFRIEDETESLRMGGIVSFLVPYIRQVDVMNLTFLLIAFFKHPINLYYISN